jgi:CHASE3 domain sensor protein
MTLRIIALFAVLAVLLVADIAAVYWREAQRTHDR